MKKMETSSLSIYRDLHDLENMSLKNKFRIGNNPLNEAHLRFFGSRGLRFM